MRGRCLREGLWCKKEVYKSIKEAFLKKEGKGSMEEGISIMKGRCTNK